MTLIRSPYKIWTIANIIERKSSGREIVVTGWILEVAILQERSLLWIVICFLVAKSICPHSPIWFQTKENLFHTHFNQAHWTQIKMPVNFLRSYKTFLANKFLTKFTKLLKRNKSDKRKVTTSEKISNLLTKKSVTKLEAEMIETKSK